MNIVLHEPEIPQNTGNIARTCAATGSTLHLIKPLGFSVSDRQLRRAGLDYWNLLNIFYYDNYDDFIQKNSGCELYMATTKALQTYCDVKYTDDTFIMFGKESAGIPEEILLLSPQSAIRIPMLEDLRSLNLAVSVAVVLYEGLRQSSFSGLKTQGQLHRHNWK